MVRNTLNNFINKANLIHNDKYDYSISEYVTTIKKIKIVCPIHGIFEQRPNDHLNGKGCIKCGFIVRSNLNKKSTTKFIEQATLVHKNKYDYSLVDYKDCRLKIKIICNKHGIFEQTPDCHLQKKGCPKCKESRGEREISEFLKNNKFTRTKYLYRI
jgi:hypothetical protein